MTQQPQLESCTESVSIETERIVHDFVREAVSRFNEAPNRSVEVFEDEARWERGNDGYFHEWKKRVWSLWSMQSDDWLRSLPSYRLCVECLKSDLIIAPHLDRLVGTCKSAFRLEVDYILKKLLNAMLDDEGRLVFTDERFLSKWREILGFFAADRIPFMMVAPLPYLAIQTFPLRLNNELVLDRFTDNEVSRCYQVGVIRPVFPRDPLIFSEIAVGIRRTILLPKLIRGNDDSYVQPEVGDEGMFGNRPLLRDDLVIDDVLSALRLFKRSQIRASGFACWSDSHWLNAGTSYRILGGWPYIGKFELLEDEVQDFLDLWLLLEKEAGRFGFSIHRFNLAFDRGLLDDRIVDLVIAAEALFLGDQDEKYRGELRYRFALRAAKFIEHPSYDEHDIFRIMRQAYDARSAIVHGGSPNDTRLPDNNSANLPTFINTVEELVRLGLRKALAMREDGKNLRQSEYWDTLIFSKSSLQ